ncbi:alpha/beta hydrolase family protein [Flindersiella endophytica]
MRTRQYRQRSLACTEYFLDVPLDHADPGGEQIEVYAREVVDAARADADLPRLLYLQGGPGGKAVRPSSGGWLARALRDYRVVLLDQRGTGLSTPANRQTLPRRGGPEAQAEYLTHFRADSIVRDAELLRKELNGDQPWTTLGQSYGGFVTLTYLSFAPEGVHEAFVTGGLPPLTATADDVYRLTYERTAERNSAYFTRHPDDRETCARIVRHLADNDVRLPTGERLTPRRFQAVGNQLGKRSGFDSLHYVLEEAFVEDLLSDTFLAGVGASTSFATNPLYAVLHEPCYTQGTASNWSAERLYHERPDFDVEATPFQFTGEMIYPFLFDEDPALVPLREVANRLAQKADWPLLYDVDRLARNQVPVWAAIYYNDQYVVRELSLDAANRVMNVTPWITNEYGHDGLREGPAVLDRLLRMSKESA